MKKLIIVLICMVVFSNILYASAFNEKVDYENTNNTEEFLNNLEDVNVTQEETGIDENQEQIVNVIGLKDKTKEETKKILEEYGLEYNESVIYEKIEEAVILNSNDSSISAQADSGQYNGQAYKIYYLHSNKFEPIIKKLTGAEAVARGLVERGINIAIGITPKYLWIPYTLLGITPSDIGVKYNAENYTATTIQTHIVEKHIGFVENGNTIPYAFFERAEVNEDTMCYLLVDEKTQRYRSLKGEKSTFYEANHYRNNTYGLQRAREMQIKSIRDGYVERADNKVHTISYQTHVQNIGWKSSVKDGESSGTLGKSLRLEGIKINITNNGLNGSIQYRTHVQNLGWQGWASNGAMSGTSGKNLRLEAIQIRLTGQLKDTYNIKYRTHVQNLGWQGWVKNGVTSGTSGKNLRLEAIQIMLEPKNI